MGVFDNETTAFITQTGHAAVPRQRPGHRA
jgi:hypothetical protein